MENEKNGHSINQDQLDQPTDNDQPTKRQYPPKPGPKRRLNEPNIDPKTGKNIGGHPIVVFNPDKHCGARSRQGDRHPCKNPKGWRTEHPGVGRCRVHGGCSPIQTGLYSDVIQGHPRLKQLLELAKENHTLDLAEEFQLLRALTMDFLNRQVENHCPSCGSQRIDAQAASELLERIGRMAERIHKIEQTESVSRAVVAEIHNRMALVLLKHIQDEKLCKAIGDDWLKIVVDPREVRQLNAKPQPTANDRSADNE